MQSETKNDPVVNAVEAEQATQPAAEPSDQPRRPGRSLDLLQTKRIIEGLLFVSSQPVTTKRLKEVLAGIELQALRVLIDELNAQYLQGSHAFRIQEVAGGYQLVTDPQLAPWMKRALDLPHQDTLRKAALETLAIVAYRQPITKVEMEVIRGVDCGGALETLVERRFVEVVGRKETPGRPMLYGTTKQFLLHFGLKDLSELPPMKDLATLPGFSEAGEAALTTKPLMPGIEPVRSAEVVVASTEPEPLAAASETPDQAANPEPPA